MISAWGLVQVFQAWPGVQFRKMELTQCCVSMRNPQQLPQPQQKIGLWRWMVVIFAVCPPLWRLCKIGCLMSWLIASVLVQGMQSRTFRTRSWVGGLDYVQSLLWPSDTKWWYPSSWAFFNGIENRAVAMLAAQPLVVRPLRERYKLCWKLWRAAAMRSLEQCGE